LTRQVHLGVLWPAEASLATPTPSIQAWWDDVRGSIADAARLHAFFAFSSMLAAQLHPWNRKTLAMEAARHKTCSVVALRDQLTTSAASPSLLVAIGYLYAVDFYGQEYPSAFVHLHEAYRMVVAMGGLRSLPPPRREILFAMNIALAYWTLSRPLFDATKDWDPGPFNSNFKAVIDQDQATFEIRTAVQIQNLLLVDPLIQSTRLVSIIRDFRELMAVEDFKVNLRYTPANDGLFRWAFLRLNACNVRILTLYDDTLAPTRPPGRSPDIGWTIFPTDASAIDACAILAAMFAEIQAMHYTRAFECCRFQQLLVHAHKACLKYLGLREFMRKSRLFLWTLFMGAVVEGMMSTRGVKNDWLSIRFATLATTLGLRTPNDLREIFRHFLYCDRTQGDLLTALVAKFDQLAISEVHFGYGP
jgi:hypothetical protein